MKRLSGSDDTEMSTDWQRDNEAPTGVQEPAVGVRRSDRRVVCFTDKNNEPETAPTGNTPVETRQEEHSVNAEELTAIYKDMLKNPNSGNTIAGVFDNRFIDVMDVLVHRRVGRAWHADNAGRRRSRRLQMMSAGHDKSEEPARENILPKETKMVNREKQHKKMDNVDPAGLAAPLAAAPSSLASQAKESEEGTFEQRASTTSVDDDTNKDHASEQQHASAHETASASEGVGSTGQHPATSTEGNRAGGAKAVGSARENFKDATDTIDVGGRLYATRVECLFSDTVAAVRKMKNRDEEGALLESGMNAMQMDNAFVSAAEEQNIMAELALTASSLFKNSENTPRYQANNTVEGGAPAGVETMQIAFDQTPCLDDSDKTLVPQSDKDETIWGCPETSLPFQRWSNIFSNCRRSDRQPPLPPKKQKRQRPLDAHRMKINKLIGQSTKQRIKSLVSGLAKINKNLEHVDWLGRNVNLADFEMNAGVCVNQWGDESDSDNTVVQSNDGRDPFVDSDYDMNCEGNDGNGEQEGEEQIRTKSDGNTASKNVLLVSPLSLAYLTNDFNSYENPMNIAIWRDFKKLLDQATRVQGPQWGEEMIQVERGSFRGFEVKKLLSGQERCANSTGIRANPLPAESKGNELSVRTNDKQQNNDGICSDTRSISNAAGRDAVGRHGSVDHPTSGKEISQSVQTKVDTIEIPEAFIREMTNLGSKLDMLRKEGGGRVKQLVRLESDSSQATTIITVRFASDNDSMVDNDELSDTTITESKINKGKKGKGRPNKRRNEVPLINFDSRPKIKMSAEGELAVPAMKRRGCRRGKRKAKCLYDNFKLHFESKAMSALSNRERFDVLSQSKRLNCREIVMLRTRPNVMLLQDFERALMSGNHNLGDLEIEAMSKPEEESGSCYDGLPSDNEDAIDNQAGEAAHSMSSIAQFGAAWQPERDRIYKDNYDGPDFDTEMFEAESETDYSDIEIDDEAVNNYLVTHGYDDRSGPAMRENWIRQARHDIARERSMLQLQSSDIPRRPRRRIVRPRQVNLRIFTRRLEDWLITVSRSGKPQVLGSEMYRHFRSKFKTKVERSLITPVVLFSSLMMIMGNHVNWDLHNTQDGSLVQSAEEAVELFLKFRDFIPLPPIVKGK